MSDGLTISRAAALAQVTVKTVRHYHKLGLLDEPARDGSGYRRYRSTDLLRLVQVRTLADAGVPLAEIGALLDADPEQFATALRSSEGRLTERINMLTERRAALRRLARGEPLLLPNQARALLERLAEAGFGAEYITMQHEAMVLAGALLPELLDRHLAQIERQLGDPQYLALMKRCCDAAASWVPDDPRLERLASDLCAKLLCDRDLLTVPAVFRDRPDGTTRYGLINHHREHEAPVAARLTQLLEAKLRAAGIEFPYQ